MHIKEKIDAWVEAHSEDFVRDVSRLVAIDSTKGEPAPGAPFGQGPAAALREMLALCREKGFSSTDYDGYVGTADLSPGVPTRTRCPGGISSRSCPWSRPPAGSAPRRRRPRTGPPDESWVPGW